MTRRMGNSILKISVRRRRSFVVVQGSIAVLWKAPELTGAMV